MNSGIKFLLFIISFAILFSLAAAESIFVPENTLLFKNKKDANRLEIKTILQEDVLGEVVKKEKIFLQQGQVIGIYADAYYLKIPSSDSLCYFPKVTFRRGKDGKIYPYADQIETLMILGALLIAIGFAALAGHLCLKSERKKYLLPTALLFFFAGYATWYIGIMPDSFVTPSDEIQYFNIAKKILAWDFTSMKYEFTIGFPVICIPFILLFQPQNHFEFIQSFMNFQTFILIPGLFFILYQFFYKKMGSSRIQSFCIVLLWLILMIFYLPICGTTDMVTKYIPENFFSNAIFTFSGNNFYFAFFQFTWLGRNAMSDYAAVFLLAILLYAAMIKSQSLIRFFVLSMGFGFLCLVRINYIFFAPLLAFIFNDSFAGLWKNKRNYLYAVLCGTSGFMIVFVWQLVLNKIQFGSPFVWPYSLHPFAPDRGFVWKVVPYGFKFLCRANYVYMVLGISSLFFIPERKIRVLLTLWIFPVLLFFTGYPIVFNNPIRFIFPLYAPLSAAIVLNPVWLSANSVRIKTALVVLCSCLLCKSNIFFIHFHPWNLGKYGISNNTFIIIQFAVCLFCCVVLFSMRKELKTNYVNTIKPFRFLSLFTAFFFLGSICPYMIGILVLSAFAYGLRDTWTAILQISKHNVNDNLSCS